MKLNRQVIVALVIMIAVSALYRVMPGRPMGFAPQIAIALFAGSLFSKHKSYAFIMPLLSMFISDLFYQYLYNHNLTSIPGFYAGQWENYILVAATTIFGFGLQTNRLSKFIANFIAAPTIYFLISNFLVWAHGGGYQHPFTATGLMQTMIDGLPFYPYSVAGTLVFGAVLFGGFKMVAPQYKTV